MKKYIGICFLLVAVGFSKGAFAQVDPIYSLYRFNPQNITPAHVGGYEGTEITVMNRQQWMGIEGAPKTMGVTANMKWGKQKGIGLVGLLDEAGPMKTVHVGLDFAYHVRLNEAWSFSGGIRGGVGNMNLNFAGLQLPQSGDESFATDRSTGMQVNTGWGVKVYKGDGLFLSVSQPRMFRYDFGAGGAAYKDSPSFFVMTGTKWRLSEKVTLYPSTLVRLASDIPLSYDVNVVANINGKLDAGLGYRGNESFGIRLGVQMTKLFYLGYVYELPTSQISMMTSQSHELALRMSISKK
jgi:type IX secretion system PorP/SprF family membrane protein